MKHWELWGGMAVFVAVALVGPVGLGDDKDKGADKPAAKAAKETSAKPPPPPKSTKTAKEAKRRLPRHYGKLGLSDAQREKIYGVQEKYQTDIDKLEKQLADVKARQDADCRKVLTADQKKQLTETIEAAKAKGAKEDEMEE